MPYKLTKGGAMRIRRHEETGAPEEVRVDARVASRAKFRRLQFMDDDLIHAVFADEKTGQHYTQPIPDQEGV